ncbi:hypothetical protein BU14_0521s0011 [Porphyra umbilicalis]|uniref:Uncharacterized protein n=1 Tax=Porphyra umbilicalis TaxID=2786 RepID=A0A1X6NSL6_PORUM|nr:hypothetical protein BU14_0521s0011 [Porphyra umbilicalis]|eukprot:OSX71578.1 hypothetical protein BU14_0521s0011 [Porphyra umbilicalis]
MQRRACAASAPSWPSFAAVTARLAPPGHRRRRAPLPSTV